MFVTMHKLLWQCKYDSPPWKKFLSKSFPFFLLNKYFCGRNLINSSQIPQYLLTLEEQNWDFRTIYKVVCKTIQYTNIYFLDYNLYI